MSSELHHCPIYPSTLLSPLDHSPGSSTPVSTPSLPSGTFSPCCLELPLPQGRLEPGKGIRTKLVMQETPFLLSSSVSGAGEIPWNIVFYYEPALISANSRLRSVNQSVCLAIHSNSLVLSPHSPTRKGGSLVPSFPHNGKEGVLSSHSPTRKGES